MVKVVFMGTPDYATYILKELLQNSEMEVSLLVTQPDKPVGRKQLLTPPHTKAYVLENEVNIPIYQPTTLKTDDAYQYISSFKPDFIVVAAFGQILPRKILDIAPCINLHASLLPQYRGASPIQSSLLNEDRYAGVTSMLMEEGLDTGDMLVFSYFELDEYIKVDKLFEKLSHLAAKLTIKTLRNYESIVPQKQIGADTSYAKKITKAEGKVSFQTMSAAQIYTKFRSYDPWPGIFLSSGLKLKEIKLVDCKNQSEVGNISYINDKSIIVKCKEGFLEIAVLQPPSKKQMDAVAYIRGQRLEIGSPLV